MPEPASREQRSSKNLLHTDAALDNAYLILFVNGFRQIEEMLARGDDDLIVDELEHMYSILPAILRAKMEDPKVEIYNRFVDPNYTLEAMGIGPKGIDVELKKKYGRYNDSTKYQVETARRLRIVKDVCFEMEQKIIDVLYEGGILLSKRFHDKFTTEELKPTEEPPARKTFGELLEA